MRSKKQFVLLSVGRGLEWTEKQGRKSHLLSRAPLNILTLSCACVKLPFGIHDH